ncbi:MAG: hypothetical protein NTZ78_01175 [Candidatus Aureabacteria bacterium]|nr:hypothetical protein [Candidatus Auribacterota bacterium]
MKRMMTIVLGVMFLVGLGGMAVAGSLDSPGDPSAGSGMYTLSQIYDYLNSGTEATPIAGFQEPGSAPGSTMRTTKQIYDDLKAKYDLCPATAADVKSGVNYFSTVSGSWGVRTGTYVTPQAACAAKSGYWAATQLTYPDDYGCWFLPPSAGASCTEVCLAYGFASCVAANWNDDTSCSIWKHFGGTSSCASYADTMAPISYYGYKYRAAGVNQVCDAKLAGARRLCLCNP